MNASPAFSIVIPTRNRAGLLRHALATALAQTVDDVEVVVSDNDSADETAAVVSAAGDPRVRYVRTDRMLAQPDSWEFAFTHARGEWVTLLSDDDALVPSTLSRVADAADAGSRVIAYRKAWYVHPGLDPPWPKPDEINHLMFRPCHGGVDEVDARAELERFFGRHEREAIPGMSNAVVHRDVLARLRREAGRLFRYPDPAAVACAGFLALERTYLAIELPLNVEGVSRVNVSSGYRHDLSETGRVVREYHADELFTEAPLRSRTLANAEAESLLRAKQAMPNLMAGFDLDPVRYFVTTWQDLTDPTRSSDDEGALTEWQRALGGQPAEVRRQVRRFIRESRLRAGARRVPGARHLAHLVRRAVAGPALAVYGGADHDFSDIVGAARYLDDHVIPVLQAGVGGIGTGAGLSDLGVVGERS